MKKKIFTLMLSAAIVITNPLWAMNSEEKFEEKGVSHQCSCCQSDLQFSNIDENAQKGTLISLPQDVLVKTLSTLPLEDVVHNVSLVSKAMYNLCQDPVVWRNRAEGKNIWIKNACCPKKEVVDSLTGLFNESKDDHIIPISELRTFMTTLSPSWTEQDIEDFGTVKYLFTRDNKTFCLSQPIPNKNFFDTVLLPFLAKDAQVTFTKTGCRSQYSSFFADIYVLPASLEYKNLSSPEYKNLIKEAQTARNPELRGVKYIIRRQ